MPHAEFVHLHNHTEYSLLDGACRITDDRGKPSELLKFIAGQKMSALAITDHGNMSGAIEFYSACYDAGIKPIIGAELYITNGSRFVQPGQPPQSQKNFHITLLAKDKTGYENLMRLSSIAYTEGFYRKPRIDRESLKQFSEGLICLSGCLHGEIPEALRSGNDELAMKLASEYRDIFGKDEDDRSNFYIELMDNGMPEQKELLPKLLELAKKTGLPVVATNDCHYLRQEDASSHEIIMCIGTGKKLADPDRLKFATDQFYYKTANEMIKLFSGIPGATENTLRIAERCNLEMQFNQILLPHYTVPEGETPDGYLRKLCGEGLKKKYPEITPPIKQRLEYELGIINKMGFAPYFLIVWDFVEYAKRNNIPVGPGRGSGAGSIVAYSLGITNICPLKYGLLFERFLNPDRKTMPDFDIDFADYGRDAIIEYVLKKYGEKNVAQIITFGTMQSKLAIKDVARVMGFSVADGDRITKMIRQGEPIYQAVNTVKELKDLYRTDENIKKLIDNARQIEGLKRHQGVHAAGLVIAKDDITKYTPLAKSVRKLAGEQAIITTQYNDDALIKLGLLKIDFLGLKTLTILEEAQKLINARNPGIGFDIVNIPLDDKNTYKLLQKGKTAGVFQLESDGMKDLLRKLRPTVFEDIVALISLYRPGPMGAGMLDEFVSRKHQRTGIKYDHPLLEPILKETYGVILYQEQVMQIAQKLAGFSAGQADVLRSAMGKKVPEEIEKQQDIFIEGAKKNGIDRKTAESIYTQILHFGGYGFNKSHAAAYGMIAYRTAYLKANYLLEFVCALFTSEIGKSSITKEEDSRLINYINESKEMNVEILPPDIQKSDTTFSIDGRAIRYALLAIKNVGEHAAKEIVSVRRRDGPFKSFDDFLNRVDSRQVNKKVVESLIKAGTVDSLFLHEEVAVPAWIRARAFSMANSTPGEKKKPAAGHSGQSLLFEISGDKTAQEKIEPLADHVVLGYEKEVLGFYISGHPLAQHRDLINSASTHKINSLPENESSIIRVAGMITNIKRLTTKKRNEQMAKFRLENFDGEVDVLVFPRTYEASSKVISPQRLIVVKGRINAKDDKPTIIADDIIPLEKYETKTIKQAQEIRLSFTSVGVDDIFIEKLKSCLEKHLGNTQVILKVIEPGKKEVRIETPLKVALTDKFFTDVKVMLGDHSWEIK